MINILRYPGGKSKVVRQILRLLEQGGPIAAYAEPFVGGASVALAVAAAWPEARLVLADIDPRIAAFWQVVADDDYRLLISEVEAVMPTVELFRHLQSDPGVTEQEQAFALLFLNRTAYSGKIATSPVGGWGQTGKWKIDAEWRVNHIVKNIEAAHHLLVDRTTITAGHFMDTWPDPATVVYADPPYFHRGRTMYPTALNFHEHSQLAERLRSHDGYWVASYDDCPETRSLYSWANCEQVSPTYSAGIRVRGKGAEILISPHSWSYFQP